MIMMFHCWPFCSYTCVPHKTLQLSAWEGSSAMCMTHHNPDWPSKACLSGSLDPQVSVYLLTLPWDIPGKQNKLPSSESAKLSEAHSSQLGIGQNMAFYAWILSQILPFQWSWGCCHILATCCDLAALDTWFMMLPPHFQPVTCKVGAAFATRSLWCCDIICVALNRIELAGPISQTAALDIRAYPGQQRRTLGHVMIMLHKAYKGAACLRMFLFHHVDQRERMFQPFFLFFFPYNVVHFTSSQGGNKQRNKLVLMSMCT